MAKKKRSHKGGGRANQRAAADAAANSPAGDASANNASANTASANSEIEPAPTAGEETNFLEKRRPLLLAATGLIFMIWVGYLIYVANYG